MVLNGRGSKEWDFSSVSSFHFVKEINIVVKHQKIEQRHLIFYQQLFC